ncbi:hypothetical protein A0H81_03268 [Grifola frondosa]|uniref:Uncharacterized protein n=1 Tax=Grifola frondosa TaxID=5627 RepID=A0A1C7MIH9_GRIFR|nr:hypothetical protein A0H81_03268 [Grifola frondosa]
MGKRPRVPSALRSELTEYSSLLRALRTSNTLDLSTQLAESVLRPSGHVYVSRPDDEGEDERPVTESISLGPISEAGSSLDHQWKLAPQKENTRDTWTRWPLLAGDVHVPEWGLEDEVKFLAVQAIQSRHDSDAPILHDHIRDAHVDKEPTRIELLGSDEDEEDSLLSPLSLRALTVTSTLFLSRLLSLLAVQVPVTEKSMQNRVRPINWETVLGVVGANGLADASMLESVKRRMELIYPTSFSHVIDRVQSVSSVQHRLTDMLTPHELGFLSVQEPASRSRKRGPYTKRSMATDDHDACPAKKRRRRKSKPG